MQQILMTQKQLNPKLVLNSVIKSYQRKIDKGSHRDRARSETVQEFTSDGALTIFLEVQYG